MPRGRVSIIFFFLLFVLITINSGSEARAATVYSLHVSSHKNSDDAAAAVAKYKARGLESYSRRENVPGKGLWYRVYVGLVGSKREAEELATRLRSEKLISYYRLTTVNEVKSSPVSTAASPRSRAGQRPTDAFKQIVYGRYVASFKYKHLAEAEAEGLTQYGWPASVSEEKVQGTMWYRVYLLPPKGRAWSGMGADGLRGFDIIADMSGSPGSPETTYPSPSGEDASRCAGYSKYGAKITILRKINAAVPSAAYQAGLRELGYKDPESLTEITDALKKFVDSRGQITGEYTRLNWGVLVYERNDYGLAINRLQPTGGFAPLSWAVSASNEDLSVIEGRKALIIVSNFKRLREADDPVKETRLLKEKYGNELCVFTIYVDADEKGVMLAYDIARAGGCGNAYDGCRTLTDKRYFDDMIRDIFYGLGGPACPDADKDGICDDQDKCPNTPRGALVDERGCWMAAIAPFFDFDQYNVKKQYLPGIRWAADILKDNPGIEVTLEGHTDSVGTDKYNIGLGMRRAMSVKKWLVRFGVESRRLKTVSYGERRPAMSNSTAKGRARNRRVEINVKR